MNKAKYKQIIRDKFPGVELEFLDLLRDDRAYFKHTGKNLELIFAVFPPETSSFRLHMQTETALVDSLPIHVSKNECNLLERCQVSLDRWMPEENMKKTAMKKELREIVGDKT